MGKKIAQKKPTSKRELKEMLINVWNQDLDEQYIKNLIKSMPNRCAAVIKARGGATKY